MLDGGRDTLDVAGGEQVKQSAAQDGEQERALGHRVRRIAAVRGLALRQQFEPVPDGIPAEIRPRTRLAEQGPGIALDPQGEQLAVGGRGQPGPDLAPGLASSWPAPHLLQVAQLVLACPGEQRPYEPVLGAEKEQQDARARPDRAGKRPQRHLGKPVAEHVLVGGLEQFPLAR